MRAKHAWVLALALVVSPWAASAARADVPEERFFYWGGAGVVPIAVTPLAQLDGTPIDALPGGGVVGRIGLMFGDVGLELAGGVRAHGVTNGLALTIYGGGAGVRWAIDVGGDVRPLVLAHANFWYLTHAGGGGATFAADAGGGAEISLASWIALDLFVIAELVVPLEVFSDVALFVTPGVGLALYY